MQGLDERQRRAGISCQSLLNVETKGAYTRGCCSYTESGRICRRISVLLSAETGDRDKPVRCCTEKLLRQGGVEMNVVQKLQE